MTTTPQAAISISRLRADLAGEVIAPDDPEYERARLVVLPQFDRRPAAIVRPPTRTTSRTSSRSRARTGSSSPSAAAATASPGTASPTAGSCSTSRDMRALEIDPDDRTAWAETGLTAGEFTTAAAEHGLATGFGDTGSVGIGGLTLGGGVGYLVRKHGLTIDDLLAAEIVTADGQLLRVDAEHAPRPVLGDPRRRRQLRRRDAVPVPAARGRHGRGRHADAAGDARRHRRLHRRGRGGAGGAARRSPTSCPRRRCRSCRRSTTASSSCMAMLVLRRRRRGGRARRRAVPRARRRRSPTWSGRCRYPEIYPPEDARLPPDRGRPRTMFVDTIDRGVAETILDRLEASTRADARSPSCACSAARWRACRPTPPRSRTGTSRIMVNVGGGLRSPEEAAVARGVGRRASRRRCARTTRGAYVNFLGDEGAARVRAAYPGATWERLRGDQASLRPGQPLPAQPEHRYRGKPRMNSSRRSAANFVPLRDELGAPPP